MTTIVHLTASRCFGGPERQMLSLAQHLPAEFRSVLLSFPEHGKCADFIRVVRGAGFEARSLENDTPHLPRMVSELAWILQRSAADVLCCHGYKANAVGLLATKRTGTPAVMVARGWTGANVKVRMFEALGKHCMRYAARLVCVSASQTSEFGGIGRGGPRPCVIRNAVDPARFARRSNTWLRWLRRVLPSKRLIVGAAGRLVKEKGYLDLLEVARAIRGCDDGIGFILFGDGPLRARLEDMIRGFKLSEHVVLAGFRADLDAVLPHLDVFVHPSYREGMPNVVLEACAASVPVVATDVGGTREIIRHGWNGYLVGPGRKDELLAHILTLARSTELRERMRLRARQVVTASFSFSTQARLYAELFQRILRPERRR